LVVSGERLVSSYVEVNVLRPALPDALAVAIENVALAQARFGSGAKAEIVEELEFYRIAYDGFRWLTVMPDGLLEKYFRCYLVSFAPESRTLVCR